MSTNYSAGAFNVAMLLMRLVFGILMMTHGYNKLIGFSGMKNEFMNFMGLGSTTSLILVIFAEFFCALFLVLGLFTRMSAIPLVICMGVALFKSHNLDFFGEKGSLVTLYLGAYLTILLLGPGKFSVDGMSGN